MRLEKKMATLLAAILIAIAGVMPALADPTASVLLTVEVVSIISIKIISPVPPDDVDFGTPRPGESPTAIITIENDGDVDVTVSETVSGEFFIANLVVDGTYTSISKGATGDADLTLNIPVEATAGTYTGSILFTASEAVPP